MAYTYSGEALSKDNRRDYGTGSFFQRCEPRYGCPPLVNGVRPQHDCKGRWFGVLEAGVTANGDRRRITVSGKSKSLVQRRLRDKRLELEKSGAAIAGMKNTTVARYAAEWLEHIQTRVTPSALTADKAAVKWITKTIGTRKLRELTVADVRAVTKALRADGKSSSTALRYHGSLLRLLKAATLDGHPVPPNVLLTEAPEAAINDRQALPQGDYKAALRVISGREDAARWAIAFLTGLRQKEALGLTWDYVDLDAGTITVAWQTKSLKYKEKGNPAAGFVVPDRYEARHLIGAMHLVRPKSRKGWRVVPLVPWAVAALRAWKEVAPENPHGLVWPGAKRRGGWWPINEANDRDTWAEIQQQAGIRHPSGRPYGTHEIRHTTATLLLELKVPDSVRQAIMGHASIEATQIYETVDTALTREALERVSSVLELGD